ncbi:MAG: DNA-binding response regulator [Myxococcales bacterium]|nr:DNA-binding response regulator [Myxococcales bacterium]
MEDAAILIAPHGAAGPLRGLVERLAASGVTTTVVDELPAAVDISAGYEAPPCVLLDLREASGGEIEDTRLASQAIRRAITALPDTTPIAVVSGGNPALILACIRAGAGDVIDLQLEGTAPARTIIARISEQQRDRSVEASLLASQRSMIEELLRDLIRTERRSIDAEDKLAAQARRATGEYTAFTAETRAPAVLLVEHDRDVADELADLLEAAGIATFAYVTGEEAVREAQTLATSTGLDLALVAAQLPGIDGLETIRRLRDRVAGLPAFLMTTVIEADLAASAADLGVVGFVQKPLADLDDVVERLAQLARESLGRTREQAYVHRIKERHERVLARYRSLPRVP